jgi:hypothetical protein
MPRNTRATPIGVGRKDKDGEYEFHLDPSTKTQAANPLFKEGMPPPLNTDSNRELTPKSKRIVQQHGYSRSIQVQLHNPAPNPLPTAQPQIRFSEAKTELAAAYVKVLRNYNLDNPSHITSFTNELRRINISRRAAGVAGAALEELVDALPREKSEYIESMNFPTIEDALQSMQTTWGAKFATSDDYTNSELRNLFQDDDYGIANFCVKLESLF